MENQEEGKKEQAVEDTTARDEAATKWASLPPARRIKRDHRVNAECHYVVDVPDGCRLSDLARVCPNALAQAEEQARIEHDADKKKERELAETRAQREREQRAAMVAYAREHIEDAGPRCDDDTIPSEEIAERIAEDALQAVKLPGLDVTEQIGDVSDEPLTRYGRRTWSLLQAVRCCPVPDGWSMSAEVRLISYGKEHKHDASCPDGCTRIYDDPDTSEEVVVEIKHQATDVVRCVFLAPDPVE